MAQTSDKQRTAQVALAQEFKGTRVQRSGLGFDLRDVPVNLPEEVIDSIKSASKNTSNISDMVFTFSEESDNYMRSVVSNWDDLIKSSGSIKGAVDNVKTSSDNVTKGITETNSKLSSALDVVGDIAGGVTSGVISVLGMSEILGPKLDAIRDAVDLVGSSVRSVSDWISEATADTIMSLGAKMDIETSALNTQFGNMHTWLTDFSNIMSTLFNVKSITLSDSDYGESNFIKLFKYLGSEIVHSITDSRTAMNSIFSTSSSDLNYFPTTEGMFTQYIKKANWEIMGRITTFQNKFTDTFNVNSPDSIDGHVNDGKFVNMIKMLFSSIRTPVSDFLTKFKDAFYYFGNSKGYVTESIFNIESFASSVTTRANDIYNLLKKVSDNISIPDINIDFSALLNPLNSIKDKVSSILNALENLDISIPDISFDFSDLVAHLSSMQDIALNTINKGFQSVQDILGSFVASQTQALIEVFVPSQAAFMSEFQGQITKIKLKALSKFGFIGLFWVLFPAIFGQQNGFEDVPFDVPVFSTVVHLKIPLSELNNASYIRVLLTSIIIFLWVFKLYYKFYRKGGAVKA